MYFDSKSPRFFWRKYFKNHNIGHRDIDHPDEELGVLYANDVKEIIEQLAAEGRKPSSFIAESLQSCGGRCYKTLFSTVCKKKFRQFDHFSSIFGDIKNVTLFSHETLDFDSRMLIFTHILFIILKYVHMCRF
jgi:hypothetical protein